jgi:2-polyprenyl-3-methyl-5-hydroxy-6-metoxy-1,4-benzoquinol methylase
LVELVSKQYWDNVWIKIKPRFVVSVPFEDIFQEYLRYDATLRCLEIGAVPGDFLIFLHKNYGFKVYGVDYSNEIGLLEENMKKNCVEEYKIFKKDFLSWETRMRFDIVCSFGFIEHFTDYKKVIKKHVTLLKKEGLLIMTVPNFRYGRTLLHMLLRDFSNIRSNHNMEVMNPDVLRKVVTGENLEILFLNYYGTFGFWLSYEGHSEKRTILSKILLSLIWFFQGFVTRLHVDAPNRFFSPHIVCVAKKMAPSNLELPDRASANMS